MWWGKGDSGRLDDKTKETLADLRRLEETGHLIALDARRAQIAIRAVDFYDDWESLLSMMTRVKNVAFLVGTLIGIYWAAGDWIMEKIAQAVGGS
tara:strand:- start:19478 stop:19762 length:285 start_codon:yes stop_codon:yes gene_type:complete